MTSGRATALIVAAVLATSSSLIASRWNKLTRLEVHEPISIPGATLTPGEYVVKLVDSPANRHIVRFLNGDQTKVIATVIAIPNRRLEPTGKTQLGFYETPAGEPVALRYWFYPGDTYGQAFVYPDKQARIISGKARRNVPSTTDDIDGMLADTSVAPDSDPAPAFESARLRSRNPDGRDMDPDAGFIENDRWDREQRTRAAAKTYGRFVGPDMRSRVDDRSRRSIEREVRHELVMLPYYGVFDHLAYRVDGSTVTLTGAVTRPTLKHSAENVVKSIEGVERVVSDIDVLPLSPVDDRIRTATYRAIYGHAALNRYALQAVPPIHIIVRNGNVTLEGVVATQVDKNIAGIQAKSVSGVFSVTNDLRVEASN